MMGKNKETDLAALIIKYLTDMEWDIYQEVQMFSFGMRADIVATKGKITWVIETKMNAGLEVISQAHQWKEFANYVSIGVPRFIRSRTYPFAKNVCKRYGIGILKCDFNTNSFYVSQDVPPTLNRKPIYRLREVLTESHKTFAPAGNADGEFWSPFKQTCSDLIRTTANTPGITLKKLIESTPHHYSSDSTARSSIAQWMKLGKIKHLRLEKIKGRLCVFPDPGSKP